MIGTDLTQIMTRRPQIWRVGQGFVDGLFVHGLFVDGLGQHLAGPIDQLLVAA